MFSKIDAYPFTTAMDKRSINTKGTHFINGCLSYIVCRKGCYIICMNA